MRVGEELIVLGVGGCSGGSVPERVKASGNHRDNLTGQNREPFY